MIPRLRSDAVLLVLVVAALVLVLAATLVLHGLVAGDGLAPAADASAAATAG